MHSLDAFSLICIIHSFSQIQINLYCITNIDSCSFNESYFGFSFLLNTFIATFPLPLTDINLVYGSLSTFFLSVAYPQFIRIPESPLSFRKYSNLSLKFYSRKILLLFLFLEPSILLYSASFGKDLFSFYFFLFGSILILNPRSAKNILFIFSFIFLGLTLLHSRVYLFLFLLISTLFAPIFSLIRFSRILPFVHLRSSFVITLTIKKSIFLFTLLLLFISPFVFDYLYQSIFVRLSPLEIFTQFSQQMGGTLSIPAYVPVFIRPLFFFIAPFVPGTTFGALVLFGPSALFTLYLLYPYFKCSFVPSCFRHKIIISLLCIVFILFGLTMTNIGIQ